MLHHAIKCYNIRCCVTTFHSFRMYSICNFTIVSGGNIDFNSALQNTEVTNGQQQKLPITKTAE